MLFVVLTASAKRDAASIAAHSEPDHLAANPSRCVASRDDLPASRGWDCHRVGAN